MLRLTVCFLITAFLFVVVFTPRAEPFATLTRVTNTPEHLLNLNPTLSDDGRTIVFESTADLANTGGIASFHALWRTSSDRLSLSWERRALCVRRCLAMEGSSCLRREKISWGEMPIEIRRSFCSMV